MSQVYFDGAELSIAVCHHVLNASDWTGSNCGSRAAGPKRRKRSCLLLLQGERCLSVDGGE